ncbi:23S rRNA (uracil(747)-C(5))-methyltransferase, partial [Klebsiella pneumoniae]|nr:23S rRNA (uracil(747)-C(5))-methyltransferase [Klebsiella pneumoniae]
MRCYLYNAGRCRSCQWLERPGTKQLADKMADLRTLLAAIPVAAWGEPVSGPEAAFRNKAKVDLTDCPLYPSEFAPGFAALQPFIARAGLPPSNVARKRGELKYLLLTARQQGERMLRFVLRP